MAAHPKPMSAFECSFTIKYTETLEAPLKISDMSLLKKIPLLMEAVDAVNPDWRTTPDAKIVVQEPISFPFDQASLAFILCNVKMYKHPNLLEGDSEDHYPEAMRFTMDQLKDICGAAFHLKCDTFMHCIAYVIGSQKMANLPPPVIAKFLELKK